ncbi:MAG: LUD domain-containing protein [Campylobacterales bacterium]|nr:LUD domain-containing protein [Campylobacterales bacterium]
MSSKESILQSIRQYKKENTVTLPDDTGFVPMSFENLFEQFSTALASVGGKAIVLEDRTQLDEAIRAIMTEAEHIVCNVPGCSLSSDDGSKYATPHDLAHIDLAIVRGEFAVAENGAVWINADTTRHRALYFLAQHIVIVVDKEQIVPTMHEAYARVSFEKAGYGVFVSGPSKTADIEQSLVIGAHGPKSGYVFLV